MKLGWKRLFWGVGLPLIASACGSSGDAAPSSDDPMTEAPECKLGATKSCYDIPDGCGSGQATCEAGSPNELGACICTVVGFKEVGPKYSYNDGIYGLVSGTDAFYWSEYIFVQGAPYSKLLVSKPLGSVGEVLVADIPGKVARIAVKDDGIYVDADDILHFSTDGKLIETLSASAPSNGEGGAGGAAPDSSGAGGAPSDPFATGGAASGSARITYTADGLLLDGEAITERVAAYQVTDAGVYYVEWNQADFLDYRSFDNPDDYDLIASAGTGRVFLQFHASGDSLYSIVLDEDRVSKHIFYSDLSLLGK